MLGRLRGWLGSLFADPRPHNAECPVTGDTFYYEDHRRCPYCDWQLWFDGTPGASHRRVREDA